MVHLYNAMNTKQSFKITKQLCVTVAQYPKSIKLKKRQVQISACHTMIHTKVVVKYVSAGLDVHRVPLEGGLRGCYQGLTLKRGPCLEDRDGTETYSAINLFEHI